MRRVKISVILLILGFMSTLTTAYAWLTLSTVNRIENITLNAVTDFDLKMSLDGITYYDEIPTELIMEKLNQLKFDDITSLDGINFYSFYSTTTRAVKNRDYISLDIYFQTTSRYKEIHLSDHLINVDYDDPPESATYITSKGQNFRANIGFYYDLDDYVEIGEVRKYYAHDAMRVSFTNERENISKIFDLSGNEERGFGKTFGAFDYYQKTNEDILNPPEAPTTIYEMSTFHTKNPLALTDTSYLVTLVDNGNKTETGRTIYDGKLTMSVWLEGWDADTFDAILKDQIKMQFIFKAVMTEDEFNEYYK